MAKVEVEEAEASVMRNATELLARLNNNPKAKRDLERAIKQVIPDVTTEEERQEAALAPALARVQELETKLSERLSKMDEDAKTRSEAEWDAALNKKFQNLLDSGYTEEGIGKIAKLMADEKIPSVEAAAAYYDRLNPKAEPITGGEWTPDRWDIGSNAVGDTTAELFKNPDKWADDMAGKVLVEMRNGRAA